MIKIIKSTNIGMEIKQVSERYLNEVLDPVDKKIFAEALQCYIHGLHRACYIMIWISIVESLKRKLYQLDTLNHTIANTAITKIETTESAGKSTDILILEQAFVCGLINKEDKNKLLYIWTQRSICAHPYNTSPINSEIIHAIEQGIKITLGKDLIFDKIMINETIDSIVSFPHFIANDITKIRDYINNILVKIPSIRHRYTFNQIQIKIIELLKNEHYDSWTLLKLRIFNYSVLKVAKLELINDTWNLEKLSRDFPHQSWIGFTNKDTWEILPERVKDLLINYISSSSFAGDSILKAAIISVYKSHHISNIHSDTITDIINKSDFELVCEVYKDKNILRDRIIYLLQSSNFYTQNEAIRFINSENGINFINSNYESETTEIGINIGQCAIHSNFEASILLSNINNSRYNDSFKISVFLGCFTNILGEFDLSSNLKSTLKHIKLLDEYDNKFIDLLFSKIFEVLSNTIQEKICIQSNIIAYYNTHFSDTKFKNVQLNQHVVFLLNELDKKVKDCIEYEFPF